MNPAYFSAPSIRQQLLSQLGLQSQGGGPFDSMAFQQPPPLPQPGTMEYYDLQVRGLLPEQIEAAKRRKPAGPADLDSQLLRPGQQPQGWRAHNPFDQAAAALAR